MKGTKNPKPPPLTLPTEGWRGVGFLPLTLYGVKPTPCPLWKNVTLVNKKRREMRKNANTREIK